MNKLIEYPMATVWLPDFIYHKMVAKADLKSNCEQRIKQQSIICEEWDTLFEIIASGDNIGIATLPIINQCKLASQFVTLPPSFAGLHTDLAIITNKNLSYSPAMETFQKYLLEKDQKLSSLYSDKKRQDCL